jgi:hypothetical protein
MSYKFKKYNISSLNEPEKERDYDYGVDYDFLDEREKTLFEINSHEWTSKKVDDLINECNSLQHDDYIQYQVEGGHLGIMIDKESVAFFNLRERKQEEEDFEWKYSEFIDFLQEFKKFLQENKR